MPYLRFSRDKRGYESTYVFHGSRTDGKTQPRMLYWFRTPPNIKVGRLSLDEDAIREIEANNPDVTFDWNKMLKVRGTPRPQPKRQTQSRTGERRGRRQPPESRTPVTTIDTIEVEAPPIPEISQAPVEVEPGAHADADELAAQEHLIPESLESPPGSDLVTDDAEEHPVVTLMGHETLTRLRARYAEIKARIAEKPLEPDQSDAIRTQAETLNPDRWRGIEEAVAGIERFEAEVDALKTQLGRRPPRSRRVVS